MDPVFVVVAIVVVAIVVAAVALWAARRKRGATPPPVEAPAPTATPATPGLRSRMSETGRAVKKRLASVLSRSVLDYGFWSDLEDGLVASDLGVGAASELVTRIRERDPGDGREARILLTGELRRMLASRDRVTSLAGSPAVILVVGVNGTGKTTTIAKLAAHLERQGKTVLLGAADTFRAAAGEQLGTWAERLGVDIVVGQPGADAASVAFDAYRSAQAKARDVVIIDTAGRLHSKTNLMDELSKIARVLTREAGDLDEVLLVIDATTGQNALSQARIFADTVGVTGVVLTKLDGTARGGIVVAVEDELDIPVKYAGIGEGLDDLVPFDPDAFVDALLGDDVT